MLSGASQAVIERRGDAVRPMTAGTLVVYAISDSFADLWPTLAAEVGLSCELTRTRPANTDPTRSVVLITAGGDEAALPRAARELRAGSDAAFAVIGAEAGHRLAASVMRARS